MRLDIFLFTSMIIGSIILICMGFIDPWGSIFIILNLLGVFLILLPIMFLFVEFEENDDKT